MPASPIENVQDTALWVATYRADESERSDALFKDPFARRLAGERGRDIAHRMRNKRQVAWSLVLRTVIIDDFILTAIADGFDTVVNLGAGLDARPYRMQLPASLRWIEVDYPGMIEHKETVLADQTPRCRLQRLKLDLSRGDDRRRLLATINADGAKILIITEGVIPYLSNEDAGALAIDLRAQSHVGRWIVDYYDDRVLDYIKKSRHHKKQMQNAPFLFRPGDWHAFFAQRGWGVRDMRYFGETAARLHRPSPMPWWQRLLFRMAPPERRAAMTRMLGYAVLEPNAN